MKNGSTKNNWNFPRYTFYVFLVLIIVLFIKFAYLSLSPSIYGKNMVTFAANRNTVNSTLYAKRGNIFDKNGNTLALNVSSYTGIAYLSSTRTGSSSTPKHVVDKELTAKKLAPILNMSEEYILSLLNRKAYQVELGPGGRNISELTKEAIEELGLPGIGFAEDQKRYYPNGNFASYILGYAKKQDNGSIVGELGIESKYNDILKGTNGYTKYQRDIYGYKIPDTPESTEEPIDGDDIYLTIDATIQRFLEASVSQASKEATPEWLTFTIMDAKTGKILGSSNYPSFDPNILNITNYENPLVSFTYEPGSTMKIYTYMCSMESGKYKGDDKYLSGTYTIYGTTIKDWNAKGWGMITYDKGFEYSSNIAVANLIKNTLSKEELKDCFKKYGFGSLTGIELSREQSGALNFNYPIEVANAGFGQGILTTPIQHLQGLSIIANNGKYIKPKIIEKIVSKSNNEVVYEYKKEESEQVVSQSTVDKMKELMSNVVNGVDAGTTGGAYKVKGIDVIAKTGTAQYYDPKLGYYSSGNYNYIYSVAGMFPKDDPEIIFYAAIKKPTTSGSLSKMVRETIKNIAKYLNIEENDTSNDLKSYILKSYINKDITTVKKELDSLNIDVVTLGNGNRIIAQSIKAGDSIIEGEKLILKTNDKDIIMPSLINWSYKDATSFCSMTSLECNFDGYGYVTNQSIPTDTKISNGSKLNITLKSKIE